MASRQLEEEAIFHVARMMEDPVIRSTYLDQVCGGDAHLRDRVESLLAVHEQEQQFLRSTPDDPAATVDQSPLTERPGSTIGRYRLMEQVGEGGMGVVFVAEQERPVRRKVALKIIKPGMDTKEVVARFEAERQALALMDHPNIAKVLDAGSTDSGRPYFVMELVRGIPITDYCDQAKLTIGERLELFIQVCQAIQHAHQKGIIHRDVKPSNVLVTLHDGKPVPKVIDFGVAKATNQRLTERTIYTRLAQIIGTPMYMSPEQAELSGLDVDTRSDVYSLGVLLYELLTGTTPFDKQRFEQAAYDEIRRIVREEEPPKPSTKIGTLGETASVVSLHRGTDTHGLSKSLRGDLDVIVMKAIEKDRARRYDTASGLAGDVQRYLNDEPIVARSPSTAYRVAKFVSRNRVAAATSALILVSMVGGIMGTTWMARNLKIEVHQKREMLRRLAEASYEEAVTAALAGDRDRATAALEVARDAGASSYQTAVVRGFIELNDGRSREAIRFAQKALADESLAEADPRVAAHALLATANLWLGQLDRWEHELHAIRSTAPKSDADYLAMANSLVLQSPLDALRYLDARPRIGHSAAGLFIVGEAKTLMGIDQKDPAVIAEAIQDLKYATFLCRNSQITAAWQLKAIAAAIELARLGNRSDDVLRLITEGRKLADEVGRSGDFPWGDYCRWVFFVAAGDEQAAWQAIRRAGGKPGDYALAVAAHCLREHDVDVAAAQFAKAVPPDDRQNEYVRLAMAHLVPGGADRSTRVRELVLDLVKSPSPLTRRHALSALCLVLKPQEIETLAKESPVESSDQAYKPGDLFNGTACLKLLAGTWSADDLLRDAGEHGFARGNAHFTIAMLHLAAGNREAAREHFNDCTATHVIGSLDYELGRAYLTRMNADPNWPN